MSCPAANYSPTGEERAWGRRLARRFGCEGRYDDRAFRVAATGNPEAVLDASTVKGGGKAATEVVGEVDVTSGEAVIVFGWATADALANGLGHYYATTSSTRFATASPCAGDASPYRNQNGSVALGEGGGDLGSQVLRGRDGAAAGEPLADVGGGAAVHECPIREQGRVGRVRVGLGLDRDRRRDQTGEDLTP